VAKTELTPKSSASKVRIRRSSVPAQTVSTVMSTFWPQDFAASAISCADLMEISRARSKAKSSPPAFSVSTTLPTRSAVHSPKMLRLFVCGV
jgi:hypothetical protein